MYWIYSNGGVLMENSNTNMHYEDFFNIDKKYYSQVTPELIRQGKVKWQHFYPHETFVKLLQTTYKVLSGQSHRSIWVEGAYGTGKSHAVLTVKSLLDVSTKELKAYFDDFKLSSDLRDQYISLKENNKILTVHRIGSSDIDKDEDLVMAIQLSIVDALKKQGYTNFAEGSVKDSLLTWLEKTPNRKFHASFMADDGTTLFHLGDYDWQLIGNIHDNPELLEETKI